MISKKNCSLDFQDSDKIVADGQHLWCDSEPRVDTVEIYGENLNEKGSLPLLREDPLISETCPLEENVSHDQ